jgi:RimJ/RimL family protein N-acetyltransferase
MVTIRHISPTDAAQFLLLTQTLAQETSFMLLEPGERTLTVAEQHERITQLLVHRNHTILVAEEAGRLIGYLSASGGLYRRNRHSVHVAIGILQAYTRQGLGHRLFAALDAWARVQALHRVELTVMTHNTRALRLYTQLGFTIEGTKRHALLVEGAYLDEYYMAKLLE